MQSNDDMLYTLSLFIFEPIVSTSSKSIFLHLTDENVLSDLLRDTTGGHTVRRKARYVDVTAS